MKPNSSAYYTRVCPQIEGAVLGAIFLRPDLLPDVINAGLRRDLFSVDAHRRIFAVMLSLLGSGAPIDIISVAHQLGPDLPIVGGVAYISELTSGTITLKQHVLHRVRILREEALRRQSCYILERGGRILIGNNPIGIVRSLILELQAALDDCAASDSNNFRADPNL